MCIPEVLKEYLGNPGNSRLRVNGGGGPWEESTAGVPSFGRSAGEAGGGN